VSGTSSDGRATGNALSWTIFEGAHGHLLNGRHERFRRPQDSALCCGTRVKANREITFGQRPAPPVDNRRQRSLDSCRLSNVRRSLLYILMATNPASSRCRAGRRPDRHRRAGRRSHSFTQSGRLRSLHRLNWKLLAARRQFGARGSPRIRDLTYS
jgi:hypothetical protein